MSGSGHHVRKSRRRASGFTLIEVVLAVSIVVGMMFVVMFFYHQAANLRNQLLQEAERVASARLLLDRLTAELRTAQAHRGLELSFQGGADSLTFVKTDVLPRSAWSEGALGRVETAQTDLKQVKYALATAQEDTNTVTTGLVRTESPLVQARQVVEARAGAVMMEEEEEPTVAGPEPLTTDIQYLQFRYWSGSAWVSTWSGAGLPKGVEVSVGFAAPPVAGDTNGYSEDIFRRVIYLPGSSVEVADPLLEMMSDLPPEGMPESNTEPPPGGMEDAP